MIERSLGIPSTRRLIFLLFALSGASALIYEVVWTKALTLVFGNTIAASSSVIAAFMGGLALGSLLFGRLIDRHGGELFFFALLEGGIGAFAYLFPSLLEVLQPIFSFLAQAIPYPGLFIFLRFGLIFSLLLIPTVLMGGTLPILCRYLGLSSRDLGREVGWLYGMNTLGAVGGSFAASFFLIGWLGLRMTTGVAISLNGLIVATLLLLGWALPSSAPRQVTQTLRMRGRFVTLDRPWQLIAAVALSGIGGLAFEVIAIRILIFLMPYTYSNIYSFATVLTTFLIGISVGSLLASRLVGGTLNPLRVLIVLQLLIGVYVAFSLAIFAYVLPTLDLGGAASAYRFYDGFLKAGVSLLVPTLLMGAAFPLATAAYQRWRIVEGQSVGELYCANTLGAIVGALGAGFFLIPAFGMRKSLSIVAFVFVTAGLLLYASRQITPSRFKRALAGIAFVGMGIWVFQLPNHQPIGSVGDDRLLFFTEGASSTILVREREGERFLQIDDFAAAGTSYEHLRNQKMMALLPLLLHPNPRKGLVIAFGTGSTVGSLSLSPEMEEITSVEIDANVYETARFFAEENHNVMERPNVRFLVEDGRNHLFFTKEQYDIITSEPLHPKRAGTVNLYTEDFYRLARAHLLPGGLMAQWVPLHELTEDELKSLIRTFADSFESAYLWMGEQIILIGAQNPIVYDVDRMSRRIETSPIRLDLAEIGFDDPYLILSRFLLSKTELARMVEGGKILTDDLPFIEYSFAVGSFNVYPFVLEQWVKNGRILLPGLSASESEKLQLYRSHLTNLLTARAFLVEGRAGVGCLWLARAVSAESTDSHIERLIARHCEDAPG